MLQRCGDSGSPNRILLQPLAELKNQIGANRGQAFRFMRRHFTHALLILSLGAGAIAAAPATQVSGGGAPTPAQLQSFIARAIDNQHRDDQLLEQYDRIEHVQTRKAADSPVAEDQYSRIVPIGTGSFHITVTPNAQPADPAQYRQQLEMIQNSLQLAIQPDAREKQDLAKYQKRQEERAELVSDIAKAFRFTWLGRETRNGILLAKVRLDPDPSFVPPSRIAEVLPHVQATIWFDESASQVVHIEAQITTDVSIGGGVLGKIYRGGQFWLEQAEIAPGVWEPVAYDYEFAGRKFVFGFEEHEKTEVSQYRHLGPLPQKLTFIRNELNNATSRHSGD